MTAAALWLVLRLLLCVAATGLVALTVLWVMYLAVMCMSLANNESKLTPFALKAGKVLLAVGTVYDVLCNFVFATIILCELPHEATISARLRRLVVGDEGWRKRWATWIAVNLLNPFSPGGPHIPL